VNDPYKSAEPIDANVVQLAMDPLYTVPFSNPLRRLGNGAAILVFSIAFTVVLPGIVSSLGGTFLAADIRAHLPAAAADRLARHEATMEALRAADRALPSRIAETAREGDPNLARDLLRLRRQLREEIDRINPPVRVYPFYLNPQLWLWPSIYFALGLLGFVLTFDEKSKEKKVPGPTQAKLTVGIGAVVYVLYSWPIWFRNFYFSSDDPGRTVYAYPNVDIDPGSFAMQELVILGFSLLIARVWVRWGAAAENLQRDLEKTVIPPIIRALDGKHVRRVANLVLQWQLNSVVLSAGFGFFSLFFWELAHGADDRRYVIQALNAHLLWACTWIVLSLPMVRAWHDWEITRAVALGELVSKPGTAIALMQSISSPGGLPAPKHEATEAQITAARETLTQIQPTGIATLMTSAIVFLIGFVAPIVHAAFR
jgi:hypothetical protein